MHNRCPISTCWLKAQKVQKRRSYPALPKLGFCRMQTSCRRFALKCFFFFFFIFFLNFRNFLSEGQEAWSKSAHGSLAVSQRFPTLPNTVYISCHSAQDNIQGSTLGKIVHLKIYQWCFLRHLSESQACLKPPCPAPPNTTMMLEHGDNGQGRPGPVSHASEPCPAQRRLP